MKKIGTLKRSLAMTLLSSRAKAASRPLRVDDRSKQAKLAKVGPTQSYLIGWLSLNDE